MCGRVLLGSVSGRNGRWPASVVTLATAAGSPVPAWRRSRLPTGRAGRVGGGGSGVDGGLGDARVARDDC